MDKKKTLIQRFIMVAMLMFAMATTACAQEVRKIQFLDRRYNDVQGDDTLTLYFNLFDADGQRIKNLQQNELEKYLDLYDQNKRIDGEYAKDKYRKISTVNSGLRIPNTCTFSVLVDLNIPRGGKREVFDVIEKLVNSAPEGCVYMSFFGDKVSPSYLVTKDNLRKMEQSMYDESEDMYIYSALIMKLSEFDSSIAEDKITDYAADEYEVNGSIAERAERNKDSNMLFVFTQSVKAPSEDNCTDSWDCPELMDDASLNMPRVYAFYYTPNGEIDENCNFMMNAICSSKVKGRSGVYKQTDDIDEVIAEFMLVIEEQSYDYYISYCVPDDNNYIGSNTFTAKWKGDEIGEGKLSIGFVEKAWPNRNGTDNGSWGKYLTAFLVMLITIAFFFFVMKILIPLYQSKEFEFKYYRRYVPEPNVNTRICFYCKQPLLEGDKIVARCRHFMHVRCWQRNDYKCSEYGQNCKTGIQKHIEWNDLFSIRSMRDCALAVYGICAGFVSWIIYDLCGWKWLDDLSSGIVSLCFSDADSSWNMQTFADLTNKTTALLVIGLLLGFFLSLVLRYNDEYRNRDVKTYMKIIGLSLLTSVIGMAAFAIGSMLLCCLSSGNMEWYHSLPAYILFSVCLSLALTIKSTLPMKSALLGGSISAAIGFIVLYFASALSGSRPWINMLLNFIIYGGGLCASLVTARMLAEKYFLDVKNGDRAGMRIPIHKWMNTGNKVYIGMAGDCEVYMNWDKSDKVAKQHVMLYIDHERMLPMLKPMATGVNYNNRTMLLSGKSVPLSNGDTFKVGETIFQYVEND